MPHSAKTACQAPGCTNSGTGKYCHGHAKLQLESRLERDKLRGTAHHRGYDSQHQKIRVLVLKRDPLCKIGRLCGGFAPSTDADHILPIRKGGARFDMSNLQGACHACHAWKTATIDSTFTSCQTLARKARG